MNDNFFNFGYQCNLESNVSFLPLSFLIETDLVIDCQVNKTYFTKIITFAQRERGDNGLLVSKVL